MSALSVRYGRSQDLNSGKGTKTTETLLWTNPNTSTARSSLDATLSQSLSNFQKIRVEYAYNTSSASADFYVVFPVKDANGEYMFPSGTAKQRMSIGLNNVSSNNFARQFYVENDTTIHFNNASRLNASGTSSTALIPWNIYGINGGYGGGSSGGGGGSVIPVYTGAYDVTPDPDVMQTLLTAGKQMTENVTVQKIPYYETSNIDGTTVYIGMPEE